ncbi:MAG: DUF2500 family protein [Christensenellales bacterium]
MEYALIYFGVLIFLIALIPVLLHLNKKSAYKKSETRDATVINKRQEVKGGPGLSFSGRSNYSESTYYYVTFNIEGIGRREFGMSGRESGYMVVGDKGKLTILNKKKYITYLRFDPNN